MPLGSKKYGSRGHKVEHRNKEDQLQSSVSLKLEGVELSYLVCLCLNIFILHRLRNKFLQLMLISLVLLPGNYTSTRAECVGQ